MPKMSNDEFVFAALGGLGEIGMNAALYGFGPAKRRKWLMVDCGVSFAGDDIPGIDLVMPDISFIEQRRDDLVGLIITHAHEDHIGAVADLWRRLRCPVYMTAFAAGLLETRRFSEPGAEKIPINIVPSRARLKLAPFDVEFIDVAHSIPESNALAIRTPAGLVVHTGDWKIDPTPTVGRPTDEKRLRELGEEGVLALICDSTNVMREGISPSEADVSKGLADIIAASPARVAVTTFASNVGRIRSVAEAARACGRQVVLVGRAMDRVADVSDELGLLEGLPEFLPAERYNYLPRDKVVVILTGSQGEQRAALARVAEGQHPDIALSKGDKVVFSSRAIPGNEKGINRIINNLVRQGVDVITDRHGLVHVSGHPRRDELAMMYEWTKPKMIVPVHGEALHLKEHADFARARGIPTVITATDGDVVLLSSDEPGIIAQIPTGRLYKDGNLIVNASEPTLAERRKLAFAGVVSICVAMDTKGEMAGEARIALIGLPIRSSDGVPLEEIISDTVNSVISSMPRGRRKDADAVEDGVEKAVRGAVHAVWGKKPVVHALVVEV
jgi:ribonuclease J